MRIAFVDLLFSWPPHGGACTDLFYTALGLQKAGHEVHLFAARYEGAWERGRINPGLLPFPCTVLEFSWRTLTPGHLPKRFLEELAAVRPEAVYVGDAFFLKPYLIETLSEYPIITRYYAYEPSCPRDFRRFKDGALCPLDYLRTPNDCRRCALQGLKREIKQWQLSAWTHEYLAGRAFLPGYHRRLVRSLRQVKVILVYNEIQQALLKPLNPHVYQVPGGVDLAKFPLSPLPERKLGERKVILMVGRAADPVKGLETLRRAASLLGGKRSDFEIWVTDWDHRLSAGVFKAVGWRDYPGISELYRQADICVLPSLWEEPFGMVAVEAMAAGRPVCASRVGGLKDIVVDGQTGFLFEPGDSAALASRLSTLLDDFELCRRFGLAGRNRVEREYAWERIIEKYYPPILERLIS